MSKKYEKRLSDLVRQYVCSLLERGINDPRVRDITVTDVDVSPDTKFARVYYSLIGDDARKAEVAEGLHSAQGWVSHEVGKRLRTRNTPHITFQYDQSLEYGDKMSRLLDELKSQEEPK